jgi:hypothetical protein
MDADRRGLLSCAPRPRGLATGWSASGESVTEGRSKMHDRGPIDRPFLALVVIVAIAVVALGVVLYPHP